MNRRLQRFPSPKMYSSSSMDREILSTLHKLQNKMAHFAALDSAHVYKTIQNQYRISWSHDFMH